MTQISAKRDNTETQPISAKRRKIDTVQPLGNLLLDTKASIRSSSLGNLARLPDELLSVIIAELDALSLLQLGACSRACYAWSVLSEGVWKLHYIQRSRGTLQAWNGSWRASYLSRFLGIPHSPSISLHGVFSDVLYLPRLACSFDATHHSLRSFKPNIPRLHKPDVLPDSPVILTGLMESWAALSSTTRKWSLRSLAERYPEALFRAEAVKLPLTEYIQYHNACSNDESPLYLFDSEFVNSTRSDSDEGMGSDFAVPQLFSQDLFKVMGTDRPDYRWLIVGPARSGSTYHQDPNGTSAWNACVTGRKAWICFPPDITPPGVHVSEDQAEVECPLSLAEWFLSYYETAKAKHGDNAIGSGKGKMMEGICEAGEVFYVPSGWWHLVVNLEPSIAVTQNFVSQKELPAVLHFMKHRSEQLSGFKCADSNDDEGPEHGSNVFERFTSALASYDKTLLDDGLAKMEEIEKQMPVKKESLWDKAKEEQGGFTFGFADGDMEDVDW